MLGPEIITNTPYGEITVHLAIGASTLNLMFEVQETKIVQPPGIGLILGEITSQAGGDNTSTTTAHQEAVSGTVK